MTSVMCTSCGNNFNPPDTYKILVEETELLPWSTPANPQYKEKGPIYLCSKHCYEVYKKNMKEFWDPDGEY